MKKNLDTSIISIGTCPLHIVHNAFRVGVNALNFSIDSFVININFFFDEDDDDELFFWYG